MFSEYVNTLNTRIVSKITGSKLDPKTDSWLVWYCQLYLLCLLENSDVLVVVLIKLYILCCGAIEENSLNYWPLGFSTLNDTTSTFK